MTQRVINCYNLTLSKDLLIDLKMLAAILLPIYQTGFLPGHSLCVVTVRETMLNDSSCVLCFFL